MTEDVPESVERENRVVKKAKRSQKLNKIDPIMLIPIKKNAFKFIRSNGTCVLLNVDSLVDYMLATGDFTDPETRIPFSDHDLNAIDQLVSYRLLAVTQRIIKSILGEKRSTQQAIGALG